MYTNISMWFKMYKMIPLLLFSNRVAAKDKAFLKRMRINYVLNTAEGKRFTQVDTDHLYYRDVPGMRYKGFQLMDLPSTDISKYFYIAANFIDEGLSNGGTNAHIKNIRCKYLKSLLDIWLIANR